MNDIKFVNTTKNKDRIPVVQVKYIDRWAISEPKIRKEVTHEIMNVLIPSMESYVKSRGADYKRGEENAVSKKFFSQSTVIDKWRKTMPTAAALYPLQKPEKKKLADGTPFDEVAERYFPHALDGEGLRSRAAIMSKIMYDTFSKNNKKTIRWASLASGAAVPVFDAAQKLVAEGKSLQIYLADIDRSALNFAKELAMNEYGLADQIVAEKRNILKLEKLVDRVGMGTQDAIDILGFFEYLPAKKWPYRKYKVTIQMPGAIDFLRAAYSLLKPGGILVLGNMRDSHSQLKFATQVVQWPYIRPRSLDRVTYIIEAAGIDRSKITYYQAGDGVYSVASIKK